MSESKGKIFFAMDYPEAVQLMLSMGVGTVQGAVEPFARQPLELPPKHENMRRVYGYLIRRRGIDKDVLDTFAYRGLVYESADYHNAVFVGVDKTGKPRHIHKRSTAAQGGFKGNAPGSEPEFSFHWIGGGDTLFLFEAPIDMLSFITLHKRSWKSSSYAAACGVSDKVLWQTLKDRPYIRKVCICLDNDEIGQKAAQRISKALAEKNIDNVVKPAGKVDDPSPGNAHLDGGIQVEPTSSSRSAGIAIRTLSTTSLFDFCMV